MKALVPELLPAKPNPLLAAAAAAAGAWGSEEAAGRACIKPLGPCVCGKLLKVRMPGPVLPELLLAASWAGWLLGGLSCAERPGMPSVPCKSRAGTGRKPGGAMGGVPRTAKLETYTRAESECGCCQQGGHRQTQACVGPPAQAADSGGMSGQALSPHAQGSGTGLRPRASEQPAWPAAMCSTSGDRSALRLLPVDSSPERVP